MGPAYSTPVFQSAARYVVQTSGPTSAPQSGSNRGSPLLAEAQRRLQTLGLYPGPIDGISGTRTQAAIGAYQHSQGLPVTGRLDAATVGKLQIPTLPAPARPDRVP